MITGNPYYVSYKIPEEWGNKKFKEICDFQRGISYSSSDLDEKSGNYLISLLCFKIGGGFKKSGIKFYKGKEIKNAILNENDIVIAITEVTLKAEIIGYPLLVPALNDKKIFYTMDTCKIQPKIKISNKYLYYFLSSVISHKSMHAFSSATTVMHLSLNSVKNVQVPIPSYPEQQKIAEILTKVDDVIQEYEKSIELTKKFKRGLMQNLLTKGISHTKFKDSEIGKIPEEWKLYSMKEFGKWVGGGTPSKQRKDFWDNSGILWISPKDMKSLEIQNSKEKITKLGLDNSSAQGIKLNSILMVVRSGILTRNFPVAITKKTVTVNQDLKGIIVNDQFNPKYILHLLLFYNNLIRLSCMKRGTTVHSMDVKLLMKFKLAVPSINEQNTIEEILSNIDSKIVNLNNKKNTLKKLKSDLIQKLTIGQIRVKV